MNITLRPTNDIDYAEQLIRRNMLPYYQMKGMAWDSERFSRDWALLDNFEVMVNGARAGILRLGYDESATYIRDLQLAPAYQGKGIGSQCLDMTLQHAKVRHSGSLILRVFSENPALKLYEKFGFVKTTEIQGLVEMRYAIAEFGKNSQAIA